MKKDKPQSSFVNIGSSSLLIIFLILSLVTFAVLSLSGAKSDYTFSEKLASHKTEYYKASNKAEKILKEIDETLAACAGTDSASYLAAVEQALNEKEIKGISLSFESGCISYAVPMSDDQELHVKLEVTNPAQSDTYYIIKAWQVVSSAAWDGDQSIKLIPMGE